MKTKIIAVVVLCGIIFFLFFKKTQHENEDAHSASIAYVDNRIYEHELDYFKENADIKEISELLNHRGNFEIQYKNADDVTTTIFSYSLSKNDGKSVGLVWAIFQNGKFAKFVPWVNAKMEEYAYSGTLASRYKKIAIGDYERALQALNSKTMEKSVLLDVFHKSPKTNNDHSIGLMIAYLLFRKTLSAKREKEIKLNAKLREKFHGNSVAIGQSRDDIEKIFGIPINAIALEGSKIAYVYGSDDIFDLDQQIHFSKLIVVYNQNVSEIIYGGDFSDAILVNYTDE